MSNTSVLAFADTRALAPAVEARRNAVFAQPANTSSNDLIASCYKPLLVTAFLHPRQQHLMPRPLTAIPPVFLTPADTGSPRKLVKNRMRSTSSRKVPGPLNLAPKSRPPAAAAHRTAAARSDLRMRGRPRLEYPASSYLSAAHPGGPV